MYVRGVELFVVLAMLAENLAESATVAGKSTAFRRASMSTCPSLRLAHGRVKVRSKGRFAKFSCNYGYYLAGDRYAVCVRSQWDAPLPKCVRPTCAPMKNISHGVGYPLVGFNGSAYTFFCHPNFSLHGATTTYCDGTNWDAPLPTCVQSGTKPATECDFEDEHLCGWAHGLNHDFDWTRQNDETPSRHVGTGPRFDHTFGIHKMGYYMYIESSSRMVNDTARLFSPIYEKDASLGCFEFYYHMYGRAIGWLQVYVRPVDVAFHAAYIPVAFMKHGNQGDRWLRGQVSLDNITGKFQIVIEGIRGVDYISDIAVDDVKLINQCTAEDIVVETTTFNSLELDAMATDQVESIVSCEGRCTADGFASENLTSTECQCNFTCYAVGNCCPDYIQFCVLPAGGGVDDGSTLPDITASISELVYVSSALPRSTQPPLLTTPPMRMSTSGSTKSRITIPTMSTMTVPAATTTVTLPMRPKTTAHVAFTSKAATARTTGTRRSATSVQPGIRRERSTTTTRPASRTVTIGTAATTETITHHGVIQDKVPSAVHHLPHAGLVLATIPVILAAVITTVLLLRRRMQTKRALGDSSCESVTDVRYLSSDEMLDFTIATPDGDSQRLL